MSTQLSPIPEGYHTATPYLIVKDGAAALAFYEKAFGARATEVMKGPDGRVRHAEFRVGDSMMMLGEHPEVEARAADTHAPVSIYLYVADADAMARAAVDAGARELSPVTEKFYGNREGGIEDPFGIVWWIATRVAQVSAQEMNERASAAASSRQ